MFSTRTPGVCTSGINTRSMSRVANWSAWVDRARPPPRCLHDPLSTARHARVRNCIAPLRWCSIPISGRSSDGCVVAYSRANRSISSAGRPTVCATSFGEYWLARSASASYPMACCDTYSRSTRPSRIITCIIASASAASLAGLICTCQSAASAVRVRIGSTTTIFAPRRWASRTSGQKCRLVTIVFVPHSTMNRLCTISSGSMPVPQPIVADNPAAATAPQMFRSRPLQPIDPNSRRSSDAIWISPCTPAELYGRMASAPDSAAMARHRDAMSASASSQLTRTNRALALRAPTASTGAARDRGGTRARDSDSPSRTACRG